MFRHLTLVLACLLLAAMGMVWGQTTSQGDRFKATARQSRTEKVDGVWHTELSGDVKLTQDGLVLSADQMSIISEGAARTVTASKTPRFGDGLAAITADTIVLKPKDKTAESTGHVTFKISPHNTSIKPETDTFIFIADNLSYNYATHHARLSGHVACKVNYVTIEFAGVVEYDWETGVMREVQEEKSGK
jgi:lipopolysaccharide export system protein LptA